METASLGPSLLAAFATVPDPRAAAGRRHPRPAIPALATAAMLEGARSIDAIAQWGRLPPPAVLRALGFTRAGSPCGSTCHLVFKALDVAAFEAVLAAWAQQALGPRGATIATDGKGRRGIHGEAVPGGRTVAACWRRPIVMRPAWCWRKRGSGGRGE